MEVDGISHALREENKDRGARFAIAGFIIGLVLGGLFSWPPLGILLGGVLLGLVAYWLGVSLKRED